MKEIIFKTFDEQTLNLRIWDEVENPKGVVQIAHGMAEHIGRYDWFAEKLNEIGFIVLGDDHRANGKTAGAKLGVAPPNSDCFNDTVKDLMLITDYASNTYKLPITLFGHSYGSFLAQSYIQKASEKINGVVLCGSACQNGLIIKIGKLIVGVQCFFIGDEKPAKMLNNLSFGTFEKIFKSDKIKNAWLSRDKVEVEKYNNDAMSGEIMSMGFFKSMLGAFGRIYNKEHLQRIPSKLPVFIISGDKDPVGQNKKLVKRLYKKYLKFGMTNVNLKFYSNARHELLNEICKEEVFEDVAQFIGKLI